MIAGEHQPLAPAIPQREGENAVQLLDESVALLLVEMEDDLTVAASAEVVAALFELGAQLTWL